MKTNRLTQYELFRLLLMLFIIIWHSIVHGLGMAKGTFPILDISNPINIINHTTISFLTALTAVAVNCFVIMTGYFTTQITNIKWDKITNLWIQTFFYSSIIALIFYCFSHIDARQLRHSLYPIYYDQYWFITKYLALMALAPFLAIIPRHISKSQYLIMIGILLFLNLSLINDVFPYGKIYSGQNDILWFITLFFTGNYIKTHSPLQSLKAHYGKLYFLFCIIICIIFISKMVKHGESINIYDIPIYNGFTYFSSLFLFLWITKQDKLTTNDKLSHTIIRYAPFALGIYLIHDNIHIREYLWHNELNLRDYFNSPLLIPTLIGISLAIFTISIFLERLRNLIFTKFKVNHHVYYVLRKTFNYISKIWFQHKQ